MSKPRTFAERVAAIKERAKTMSDEELRRAISAPGVTADLHEVGTFILNQRRLESSRL